MKTLQLSLFILAVIISLGFGLKPAHADDVNGITIQNFSVYPYTVKVGNSFTVTATLVNNSTVPIVLDGGTCVPIIKHVPLFTVKFDNHTTIKAKNQSCADVGLSRILNPGKNITGISPDSTLYYVATESGTANVTVTFSYHVTNKTDPTQPNVENTISKSLLFTIYDNSTGSKPVNAVVLSPIKQFKSGILIHDIKCYEGLELVIKATNGYPACVKPTTATRLLSHGWITLEVFESTHTLPSLAGPSLILINPNHNETSIISNQTDTNNVTITSTLTSSPIAWKLVSMTKPEIKILSIEMTPNPLKVGDKPEFTMTYQNISDKTILQDQKWCGTNPSLHWQITPLSNVRVQKIEDSGIRCVSTVTNVKPSETYVADGYGLGNLIYQITKSGELGVTLDIDLGDGSGSGIQATVQFSVNATNTNRIDNGTSNITIFAGDLGPIHCPLFPSPHGIIDTKIKNMTGFVSKYSSQNIDYLILNPGKTGKINFEYSYLPMKSYPEIIRKPSNITNYGMIIYMANVTSAKTVAQYEITISPDEPWQPFDVCHYDSKFGYRLAPCFPEHVHMLSQLGSGSIPYRPGIGVDVEPKWVMVYPNSTSALTATISANQTAIQGSYWLNVGGGLCGPGILDEVIIQ